MSRLNIRYPIIQGPFGGGYSSPRLVAAVSNAGGLGSYGLLNMTADGIRDIIAEIRKVTASPFAVNLWIRTEDAGAFDITTAQFEAALEPLRPFYAELGVQPPAFAPAQWPKFEDQIEALLEARPPVFSFIFGIPPASVFEACRTRGIITMATITTVEEAVAAEAAGADVIIASGFEAGGHRGSFLGSPEASLTGTFALIPQVADAVRIPVAAAGGIADGRGVAAALTLGADGVQIGTAFLATDESGAPPAHKEALHQARARKHGTILTRAYTGRLARGLTNRLGETLHAANGPMLPYPVHGHLVRGLREEALKQGRTDLVTLWAGQSVRLVKHRKATELFEDLVAQTEHVFAVRRGESTPLAL